MKAEVTFLAPNTRVNSNHLPMGELKGIDIYVQGLGNPEAEGKDGDAGVQSTAGRSAETDGNKGDPATDLNDREGRARVRRREGEQSHTPEPDEGDLPATNHDTQKPRRRGAVGARKVTTVSGEDIRKGSVDIEVEAGLQYFTLVAVDTDGRESEPSAPFRLNPREDSSEPIRAKDAPSEAGPITSPVSGGHDPDRPSLVTKVNVRLL